MFLPVGTDEARPRGSFPFVTIALVALNVAVFGVELVVLFSGGEQALNEFIVAFGAVPREITTGIDLGIVRPTLVYRTLFTSLFVHAGLLHIAGNMLYLGAFGDNVEDRMGHLGFLAFYLLSGLAAGMAQIVVDPSSTVPSVGASGAVAGVLAGYLVLFPTGQVRALVILGFFVRISRLPALFFILFWFATQFLTGIAMLGVETAETGGVAYWAHIGGFAAGLVLVALHKMLFERGE